MQEKGRIEINISVIGDAFADVFCFLNATPLKNSSNGKVNVADGSTRGSEDDNSKDVLVPLGGCILIDKPLKTMPGGSGINTATHLRSLINNFLGDCSEFQVKTQNESEFVIDEKWNLQLQTVLNPTDEHGAILMNHANKWKLPIVNCHHSYSQHAQNPKESADEIAIESFTSTPHVIVIVSPEERSFIAHLGCIAHFHANSIDTNQLIKPIPSRDFEKINSEKMHTNHLHMHIAGYYNIQGFWNDQLKRQLLHVKNERAKLQNLGYKDTVFTTSISLTPQYDSLQEWDGGILSLLECVDFLILSEDEAAEITKVYDRQWIKMARCFQTASTLTFAIVTLGKEGAIALYNGAVVHQEKAHTIEHVVDPTGAGDSFAAGFVYGFLRCCFSSSHFGSFPEEDSSKRIAVVKNGMKWGCAVGAACVRVAGASIPAQKHQIQSLLAS